MARTKQTAKKSNDSTMKISRKQLATVSSSSNKNKKTSKKRKLEDIDGDITPAPNVTKKFIKTPKSTSINSPIELSSSDESDESSSSSSSSDQSSNSLSSSSYGFKNDNTDSDSDNDYSDDEAKILNAIKDLYKNKNRSKVRKFNDKLQSMADNKETELDDLDFRDEIKKKLIMGFKNLAPIIPRTPYSSFMNDNDKEIDIINNKQINKLAKLMDKMVIFLRNNDSTEQEDGEFDYRWTNISKYFEIAFKSNKAHPQYKTRLNKLFKKVLNNTDIVSIISDYSHCGYRLYHFNVNWEQSEGREPFEHYQSGGVMFNSKYKQNDYFKYDNISYKTTERNINRSAVKFDELKKDLNVKEFSKLNEFEISFLMMGICIITMDLEDEYEIEDVTPIFKKLHSS